MSANYVYRVFDESGRLIYVGCTSNLFGRLRVHQTSSWWAYQAVRVRASVYPDRTTALAAECAAIHAEAPRWNVKGRFADNASWSADDYVDYATSLLNQIGSSPARVRHLHQVGRGFRARFNRRIPVELPPHPDGAAEDRWLDPIKRSERLGLFQEAIKAAEAVS